MASVILPPIDADKYPPRRGLEGPFRFRSGIILYYDPMEGKYYNAQTDMYVDNDEMQHHMYANRTIE